VLWATTIKLFFFWGTFSFNSWVFRFPMRLISFISSLSLSYFNVVDLTSQDGERAQMIFLTFWSLSISSPKEARSFVILVNLVIMSSIDSFSFIEKFHIEKVRDQFWLSWLVMSHRMWQSSVTESCGQICNELPYMYHHHSRLEARHNISWH